MFDPCHTRRPLSASPLSVCLETFTLRPRWPARSRTVALPLAYTYCMAESSYSLSDSSTASPTPSASASRRLRTRDVMLFSSVSRTEASFGSSKMGSFRKKLAISS